MFRTSLVVFVAALQVGGCGPQTDPNGNRPAQAAADSAEIIEAIRARETLASRALAARDLDAIADGIAPNGTLTTPSGKMTGPDELRAAHVEFFKDPAFQVEFVSDQIEVARSGDLAYSRGRYASRHTDPTSHLPVTERGTFLRVWRRQDDGIWRKVEAFYVPSPTGSAPR
jgi:uncharacterized protein (TIGR02246 family)